jgi:carbon-monoxide dehydrogenase large subunit
MAVVAGTAAHRAAREVHDRAIAAASELLGLAPSALQLEAGRVEAMDDPSRGVALGELASRLLNRLDTLDADDPPPGLDATAYFAPERASLAMGVHIAEVEVRRSGEVSVRRYVVCSDAGRPINQGIVDGQLRGAVIQGIGGALYERLIHDDEASLLTRGFSSYPVPRTLTSPRVELVHIDTPSSTSELGVKGVGEAGVFPVAAVIASAVENALGLKPGSALTSTPLLPEALTALVASSASRAEFA